MTAIFRPRKSPYPMISVEEAQSIVLAHCKALKPVWTTLDDVQLGSVLAADVSAKDALPPFPASIKDG